MPHALVTGANRGLGLEHVRQFLRRGWIVTAACRAPDAAGDLKAVNPGDGRLAIEAYDAASAKSAQALAERVDAPVDVLLANAGVMGPKDQEFGAAAQEGWVDTLRINALAPLALVEAFADKVAASEMKVVALQSSRMGSIEDNASGGRYAYRASKAALNAVGKSLAVDLRPKGIIVLILHPGWVKTDMGGPNALLTVREAVEGQQDLIDRANPAMTGRFYHSNGQDLSW